MTNLNDILKNIKTIKIIGNQSVEVKNICFDSRKATQGSVFIAVKGTTSDGHDFITVSIEKGADVIICQDLPKMINESITYVQVPDPALALGLICSNFYGNPSEKLILVGVTGTNGKTTTATLLYRLFRELGYRAGLLSTVINYINDDAFEATHTTPDPVQLNQLLSQMVIAGCQYCFMEVSSHSLDQKRTAGLKFKGAIFSNLTHDHLDYHKNFDNYFRAKKLFFDQLDKNAFAVTNADDRKGKDIISDCKAICRTYAMKSSADFKVRLLESHFNGSLLNIDGKEIWVNLIGEFNAYNLLAIYSAAVMLEMEKEEILKQISKLKEVRGRFETIRSSNGIIAIVDYAHTPDAIDNVLRTINRIRKGDEQVITVIGAGGNRDKTKRPVMAKVAVENSDKVILTSDNPRLEKPEDILKDMEAGIPEKLKNKSVTITDRKEAIRTACLLAKQGDIILVAGKGHETYQDIQGVKHHFDDHEILTEILK